MSELAFDKEGNPFRFSRRTKKLRPRRWKNAGQRGTCAAVLDADGEQILLDADAEYVEFRATVGNVPGFYRLDQCDDDGAPIEDAPPAYVSIDSTRNAAPIGEADPRDAIIRDLAQINADMVRTIAERFGNVMQSTADILRAADGAGLSRREPPPPPPAPNKDDEDDEDEDEDEDEDDEEPEPTPPNPFGALMPLVELAMPHLPTLGAFLWGKLQAVVNQNATPPPAATSPAAPAASPAPDSAPNAAPAPTAPSAAPAPAPTTPSAVPSDIAAGWSTLDPIDTPAPVPPPAPVSATSPAPAAASPPAPAPAVPAAPAISPVGMRSESPTLDGGTPNAAPSAAPPTTALAIAAAPVDAIRNAPPTVEPTPEQWAHLFAIQARLSPREAAIARTVAARMSPEVRAQWLADLSLLSVDQAADIVRSMIPKAPPKPPPARSSAKQLGSDGEG